MQILRPHSPTPNPDQGIRVVVNLALRHAIAFFDTCSRLPGRGRYVNRVAATGRVGVKLTAATKRERVDRFVARTAQDLDRKVETHEIVYTAVELNATGIAYFGDLCLVLKWDDVPADTLSLLHNSYDLAVAPIVQDI